MKGRKRLEALFFTQFWSLSIANTTYSNGISNLANSQCEDDTDWVTGGTHPPFSGKACSDFGDQPLWCIQLGGNEYKYKGKTILDACCFCLIELTDAPTATSIPSTIPTANPTTRSPVPATSGNAYIPPSTSPSMCENNIDWRTGGTHEFYSDKPCSHFQKEQWCELLDNDEYKSHDGLKISDACCLCGGSNNCYDLPNWEFNEEYGLGCTTLSSNPDKF